jgi:hypothetical protein
MRGIRGPVEHGTRATYQNHGCKCEACRAAQAAYQRQFRDGKDPAEAPHGTDTGYLSWRCRCVLCREAHADSKRIRVGKGRCGSCRDSQHGVQCRGPVAGCCCRCRPMLGLEGPFEFGDPTAPTVVDQVVA